MASEANKAKLGVFVTFGVIFAVVAVTVLGAGRFFRDSYTLITYFKDSVQGLERGAPVKYRGVPIGTVTRVYIPWQTDLVAVQFEIFPGAFVDPHKTGHNLTDLQLTRFVKECVDLGYRIQLNLVGITGLKYLEIDLKNPKAHPVEPLPFTPPYICVPSIPSTMQTVFADVALSVKKLSKVDFEGMSVKVNSLLAELDRFVTDINASEFTRDARDILRYAKRMTSRLEAMTARVNAAVEQVDIKGAVKDMRETVAAVRNMAVKVDRESGPMIDGFLETSKKISSLAARLDKSLAKVSVKAAVDDFRGAMQGTASAARAAASLRDDMRQTMRELEATLKTIRRFVDYLERNPNALITGKPQPN